MSDRLTLRGMRFMGRHGVGDEERATAQPFEVDVALRLDLSRPGETDDLADTINYASLYELTREIVEERSFHLIEAVASAIADAVLEAHHVDDVEVRVRKPKAPLPGAFETVEARLRRRRSGGVG
ncbi:MAG: dihydroneopterin aldolase [Chloroflexota bacterium]